MDRTYFYRAGCVAGVGVGCAVVGGAAAWSFLEKLAVLLRYQMPPPVANRAIKAMNNSSEPRQDFMRARISTHQAEVSSRAA